MSALLRGWILAASARALAPCTHGGILWGARAFKRLCLVPHAATPGRASDQCDGERSPRDVAFVDSAHTGFGVVRAEVLRSPAGQTSFSIHDAGTRGALAALFDLPPGQQEPCAWHPRFPAASQALGLIEARATRVDIELGIARAAEAADPAYPPHRGRVVVG